MREAKSAKPTGKKGDDVEPMNAQNAVPYLPRVGVWLLVLMEETAVEWPYPGIPFNYPSTKKEKYINIKGITYTRKTHSFQ